MRRSLVLLFPLIAACGGSTSGDATEDDTGAVSDSIADTSVAADLVPCTVSEALAVCANCHGATPTFGAPMPLVTRADFLTLNERRAEVGYGPVEGGDSLGAGLTARRNS